MEKKIIIKEEKFKIINGDAYEVFNLVNEKIDAIITDPPYNISKKNNFKTLKNKRHGVDFGEWDKNFDLYSWIDIYTPMLKEGGSIIIFCSFLYISFICEKLIENSFVVKDALKWVKSNPMPRNVERRYVSDTEYAIWAIKPKKKWTFNKPEKKSYIRSEFNSSVVSGKEKINHPTQKSLKIMKEIIEIHTNKNDLILDPFMGSGTTGVAALNLKRKFIGIEKEKKYFDISEERIKNKC